MIGRTTTIPFPLCPVCRILSAAGLKPAEIEPTVPDRLRFAGVQPAGRSGAMTPFLRSKRAVAGTGWGRKTALGLAVRRLSGRLRIGRMVALEEIKPGARLRGLDPEGIAEVVQVARFGADALNL